MKVVWKVCFPMAHLVSWLEMEVDFLVIILSKLEMMDVCSRRGCMRPN